jgi:hypothetical protein
MMKSRLSATAAGFAALMLVATVTASTASAHELKASGSPSNLDDNHSGYFVWNDGHDLHLQMSSDTGSNDYRGTLHTDGKFKDLSHDGDNLHAWISDDGHTLQFHATPNSEVDGVKIRVKGSDKVDLDLKRDGDSAPTDRIWIGKDNDQPNDHNFSVRI